MIAGMVRVTGGATAEKLISCGAVISENAEDMRVLSVVIADVPDVYSVNVAVMVLSEVIFIVVGLLVVDERSASLLTELLQLLNV